MTARQPACGALGRIHPESVIACVRFSDADGGTLTTAPAPSKRSARPCLPFVHVAPLIAPVLRSPEESAAAGPDPASNEYAATSPPAGATGFSMSSWISS